MDTTQLKKRIRTMISFFIIGLVVSGLTAIPLIYELTILNEFSMEWLGSTNPIVQWIGKVLSGLSESYNAYPFIAYGTDWLAFAHLVIAVSFIGPIMDPVRNKWVIQFGMIACIMVIPFAIIAGEFRQIPIFWRAIDCLFGIVGFIPLWICYKYIQLLEKKEKPLEVKKNFKVKVLLIIACLVFVSFYLIELRILLTQKMTFIFLVWNLFLALLPLLISFAAYKLLPSGNLIQKFQVLALLAVWLLFFPNAPYVLTDFIHLKTLAVSPILSEALLIGTFAIASLLSGIASLIFAYKAFRSILPIPEYFFMIACSFLGGFGVYLGRFLRWNSWDVFKNPLYYIQDGLMQLTNPLAIKITVVFGLIIFIGYYLMFRLEFYQFGNKFMFLRQKNIKP